jgi:hypothetical protein
MLRSTSGHAAIRTAYGELTAVTEWEGFCWHPTIRLGPTIASAEAIAEPDRWAQWGK